jgi:hypothetical protein
LQVLGANEEIILLWLTGFYTRNWEMRMQVSKKELNTLAENPTELEKKNGKVGSALR